MKIFVVLISSFAIGVFTGVYLYFTEYRPAYVLDDPSEGSGETILSSAPSADTFRITAETYGTCADLDTCASYEIVGNGAFVYEGDGTNRGSVSSDLQAGIEDSLDARSLRKMERTENEECDIEAIEVGASYLIEYQGETYVLDSCMSDFDPVSDLGRLLTNLWNTLPGEGR